jgi:hypothetical protein
LVFSVVNIESDRRRKFFLGNERFIALLRQVLVLLNEFIVPLLWRSRVVVPECPAEPTRFLNLRPQIAAETFGFNGGENDGYIENPGGFRKRHGAIINDGLPVEIGSAKEHLRLVVDQRHHAVVCGQQTFIAPF